MKLMNRMIGKNDYWKSEGHESGDMTKRELEDGSFTVMGDTHRIHVWYIYLHLVDFY